MQSIHPTPHNVFDAPRGRRFGEFLPVDRVITVAPSTLVAMSREAA